MNLVYTTDVKSFDTISVGSNYLYQQYEKVQSFLHQNYKGEYSKILAKPVLTNETVQWYAGFDGSLSRLSDLSKNTQDTVLTKYWETIYKLRDEIGRLSKSSEKEKQNWSEILSEVFNENNNIILSDGNDWCLLWGWKYSNGRENYLPPNFIVPVPVDGLEQGANEEEPEKVEETPVEQPVIPVVPPVMDTEDNGDAGNADDEQGKKKSHFWYRVKRFFRNFVYRYWGLLLLIMMILLFLCLCKRCNRDKCNETQDLKQRLIELENKARERCE